MMIFRMLPMICLDWLVIGELKGKLLYILSDPFQWDHKSFEIIEIIKKIFIDP